VKGDFSRTTFAGDKHYRRVLVQQGRVELDADANEQIAIDAHLSEVTNTDVIGAAGYPVGTDAGGTPLGGFALTLTPDKKDVAISTGRMYVDGILVENSTPDATLLSQPGLPTATLAGVGVGAAGIYLAYLEVWERLVTALDDPLIRESALGGPDTAVRSQVVWQVRLARVGGVPQDPAQLPGCADVGLSILPAAPTGTLTASTGAPPDPMPCMLPPDAGYQRLENQLYRVEVHTPGADGTATFKWSRENASVVALIVAPGGSGSAPTTVTGPTFSVTGLSGDPTLGLQAGDWVEVTDDAVEHSGQPGTLYQVATTPSDCRTVTINGSPTATLALHPKLRRWDMSGAAYASGVPITSGAPIPLEGGLQVTFSAGTYRTGDYWLIPARTATSIEQGHIEWPVDSGGTPLAKPPAGVGRHVAKLGLLELAADQTFAGLGSATEPTDCRLPFWPLTQLTPDQRSGPCTIVVQPGPGWEVPVLNWFRLAAQNKQPLDAEICFPVGDFPTADVVRIQNAGHVRFNGGGWGTRLTATGSAEAVLQFDNCTSVTVRDLYASTGNVATPAQDKGQRRINGTLSFYNCGEVRVKDVWARCGSALSRRGAACVTVASDVTPGNTSTGSGTASVRGCRLHPGEMQVGLQLIHLERAVVEDNEIEIDPTVPSTSLRYRLEDPGYLAIARSHLLSHVGDTEVIKGVEVQPAATEQPAPQAQADKPKAASKPMTASASVKVGAAPSDVMAAPATALAKTPVNLQVGNQTLSALTDSGLTSTWQTYLKEKAPNAFATPTDAKNYLKQAANSILTDPKAREGYSAFASVLQSLYQHVPLAGRGISYGGQGLGLLSITGNTISGVLMGISVGVSHTASADETKKKQRTPDRMNLVRVADNTVACGANDVASAHARFAIFVGNADSVEIERNRLDVKPAGRAARPAADAIRVVGYLGPRMIVRGNYTSGFAIGIRVMPLVGNGPGQRAQVIADTQYPQGVRNGSLWLVADNVVTGAAAHPVPGPFEPTKNPTAGPNPYLDAWACLLVDNVVHP
jgi:hypothetical protein